MKKSAKSFLSVLGFVVLIAALFTVAFNFSNIMFTDGYQPYGESTTFITDLQKDYSGTTDKLSSTKYWDITRSTFSQGGYSQTINFDGNDFELRSFPITSGNDRQADITYTTKEDFSERDFKATIIGNTGGCTARYGVGGVVMYVGLLKTNNEYIGLGSYSNTNYFDYGGWFQPGSETVNIQILASPLTNTVKYYANGVLAGTQTVEGQYKIQIKFTQNMGSSCGRSNSWDTPSIAYLKNPEYKSQYGCTVNPDEQYYTRIYNENQQVSLSDFDRFTKFCTAESPASIYTNAGSTTNTEILNKLVNKETLTVPAGQIWTVQYIGTKPILGTSCEQNYTYVVNTGKCTAKTALSITFPEDVVVNESTNTVTIETEPAPYISNTISTYKTLEQNSKIQFTDIYSYTQTENVQRSFDLLGAQFVSQEVVYLGSYPKPLTADKDSTNWQAKFVYNNKAYSLQKGQKIQLTPYISVELTDLQAYFSKTKNAITQYKAEYTFAIDTSFVTIALKDNVITVSNSLTSLAGGLTLLTEDVTGTTSIQTTDKTLIVGDTTFLFNTQNLRNVKARPYIYISTPDYKYTIGAKAAITTDVIDGALTNPRVAGNLLIQIIVFGSIIIGAVLVYLRLRKR